jgi:hypothetical protein
LVVCARAWLAAFVLFAAAPAQAAVYAVVRATPDEVTVINPAGIEPADAGVRRAWSVTVKKSLVSGGPPQPGYVRTLNEYDCAQRRMRWTSFAAYSRFGALVMQKDNPDAAWTPADDLKDAQIGLVAVCDGGGRNGVVAAGSVSELVMALMRSFDEAQPLPPLQTPYVAPASARSRHARVKKKP